ncbi:type II toxin-antitoxin system Phd/YefM family antitoxin [Pseudonocardia sp. CA-142604]|uniref:type II toxin-antitoxin system Phd/YefM family antitoxin n=1 Tax=Pseudonocardia sp. CA-142604 TaxID=3240024 RepID=UPI003D912637
MRRVAEGESFTVTVHGRAVADLVPHRRATSRRRLVPAAELDELLTASGPAPDHAQWARNVAEADELFGDEHSPDPRDRDGER